MFLVSTTTEEGDNTSKEFRAMIDAVAPVNELYADSTANEFGG